MTNRLYNSNTTNQDFVHYLRSLMAHQALQETSANGVAIALKDGSEYVCRATAGEMAPGIGVRLQNDTGITAACIRSARAVVCADAANDERVNAAACKELGITSILVVPIKNGQTVVGVIEALSEKVSAFGAGEQAALERIAQEFDEASTPSDFLPLHEDVTQFPELPPLMSPIEGEGEKPAGAEESPTAVLPAAEPENEPQRHGFNFAVVVAPLAVICALSAAGFMIVHRSGTGATAASEKLAATVRTLPLNPVPKSDRLSVAAIRNRPLASRPPIPAAEVETSGRSIRDLEASARAGDASAQVRWASALASGAGVTADPVSAEAWYIVAHLAGNAQAADEMRAVSQRLSNLQIAAVRGQLATMYWKGIGVKRDPTAAYFWLIVAEAAGAPGIAARRQHLAMELAPSQIVAANLRAQQWLKQHRQLVAQDWNQ